MNSQRIALVTGANKGLGLETSRQLAEQGIRVLMACRNAARGRAASRKLQADDLDVEFVHLDVTNRDHIAQAVKLIRKQYGRLDILVNNAGASFGEDRGPNSTASITPRDLRRTFDVNFFGAVELTQAMLPLIRKSEAGRIVNVSSIMGSLAVQSSEGGMAYKPFAYDSSKTALNAFTIHLAAALRDTAVKVNSAHPGWVRTDMGGQQAPLLPAEGARTAVRLATLGPEGPTGRFFHGDEEVDW